jgi:hypothetical protein
MSKERPGCRKAILGHLKKYNLELLQLLRMMESHTGPDGKYCVYSDGLVKQCRKMVWEAYCDGSLSGEE